ncbi:MAG: YkgJ family cysteine cluster protein [Nitrosopumilus sp.]|nr:YkgJ family cysteine cluster protein [Nitrosopumilus sp.]
MDFSCVEDCSDCCVRREYHPTRRHGKVGVLLLPGEVGRVRELAAGMGLRAEILPRIGVSGDGGLRVIAYQLMGIDGNGDTCPFLGDGRSPHGGRACTIYGERPLACRAYPLSGLDPVRLDAKCRFCGECGAKGGEDGLAEVGVDGGLGGEEEALREIIGRTAAGGRVWRYATGTCEPGDEHLVCRGWIRD